MLWFPPALFFFQPLHLGRAWLRWGWRRWVLLREVTAGPEMWRLVHGVPTDTSPLVSG